MWPWQLDPSGKVEISVRNEVLETAIKAMPPPIQQA